MHSWCNTTQKNRNNSLVLEFSQPRFLSSVIQTTAPLQKYVTTTGTLCIFNLAISVGCQRFKPTSTCRVVGNEKPARYLMLDRLDYKDYLSYKVNSEA